MARPHTLQQRPPRVLWLSDEPPDRALGGGNIRQAHLLVRVARRADVTLVVMGEVSDPSVRSAVHELVEVPSVRLPQPRSRTLRRFFDIWLALGARGPREVAITRRRRRAMATVVAEREPQADLVVAIHPSMCELRPARPTARWTGELQFTSSAQARQEQTVTQGRRRRWLLRRQEAKAAAWERQLVGTFDRVVVVSAEDAATLPPATVGRVVVAPNGVDTTRYTATPLPDAPEIVMTGSFQYPPNVDGARWFADEVFPLVTAEHPAAVLHLVGREPRSEVVELSRRPGIELHPDVPDMAPWLDRARVCVVPLRVGTGTRLKALEAMSAGRPVVGTSVGLSGLELEADRHALVADDAADFAASVSRVLADTALATGLAKAGRELVEERYDWRSIGDRLATDLLDHFDHRSTAGE